MSPAANPQRGVKCPTAGDALIGAILTAAGSLERSTEDELCEVTFGRYADKDAGWHWELETRRVYRSDRPVLIRETDSLDRRVRMIVSAWERAVKLYAEPEEGT